MSYILHSIYYNDRKVDSFNHIHNIIDKEKEDPTLKTASHFPKGLSREYLNISQSLRCKKSNIKVWIFKGLRREFSPLKIDIESFWLDRDGGEGRQRD